jgi:DNA-binding Lrp family transcriptional regulator
MQTIFVQVKCELGEAYRVADAAEQDVESISEVYSTSGQYDLMMKCYLAGGEDIGHFMTEKIQRLSGVKDTFTIITFKAFG